MFLDTYQAVLTSARSVVGDLLVVLEALGSWSFLFGFTAIAAAVYTIIDWIADHAFSFALDMFPVDTASDLYQITAYCLSFDLLGTFIKTSIYIISYYFGTLVALTATMYCAQVLPVICSKFYSYVRRLTGH